MKKIIFCTTFGIAKADDDIVAGDPVANTSLTGVLSEICLLSGLDIPDLETK